MAAKKSNSSWYIDMGIVVAIYALFQFILPAPEPITRGGMASPASLSPLCTFG